MADKLVKIEMPPRDRWGENIPDGGTSCSNCEYLKDREKMLCGNPSFVAWSGPNKPAGSPNIPAKSPDEYCSIWWESANEEESEELKQEAEEEFGGGYKYRRNEKKS
ncbi:MAG TPA: hypothetical protein VN843_13950 [Anaerolineales bacterium]|nr:hypothetical protein [Anaerolineales bacterium]